MIPLAAPHLDDGDVAAVAAVLRSGQLVQGARVREFEAAAAARLGCGHAVAVSSGTAALHVGLLALGVRAGDAVALPTYSWPATANVIELVGGRPVFIDLDAATFNMDPNRLEDALRRESVRLILPVHAFGLMADMASIGAMAGARGIPILEDAACALAAERDGRVAGRAGTAACFSFHPRKAVTTGEGGLLTTEEADLARQGRALRNHGLDPEAAAPDFILAGYNLRMTEFQAALGVSQLGKLDRLLAERRRQAGIYDRLLEDTEIAPPLEPRGARHVYQSYVVQLPAHAAPRREAIIAELSRRGVQTTIGTHHIPLTRYYRQRYGHGPGDFPVTDDVAARALTLPLFPGLTPDQQEEVAGSLAAAVEVVAGHA